MSGLDFDFAGQVMQARPSGALWWADARLLCVSDLHLGKSERHARRGGAALPPYEVRDTLARLAEEIATVKPDTVVLLGDTLDDDAVELLGDDLALLRDLQTHGEWVWIKGNHDDAQGIAEYNVENITFRHIADPSKTGEISGHYHPKHRVKTRAGTITRPAFLHDTNRVILPAFGTYTGGLRSDEAVLRAVMTPPSRAYLTGPNVYAVPL